MGPRLVAAGLLALLLGGCGAATPFDGRRVPPACEFPPGTRLSFAGETTMAELWIPAPGREHEIVYAWVTADPLMVAGGQAYRVACVEHGFRDYARSAFPGSLYRQGE